MRWGSMGKTVHIDKVWCVPAVWRVRIPFSNLGQGDSNCYFVRCGKDWLIIDPGAYTPQGREAFLHAMFALGVDFSRCSVFLTHMHFDHAEMVRYVLPAHMSVYVSRLGIAARMPSAQRFMRGGFVRTMLTMGANPEDAFSYAACDAEVAFVDPSVFDVRFVSHDDEIHVGDTVFCVLETPGHTLDHLCLVQNESRVLFGGDMVCRGLTPSIDISRAGEDTFSAFMASLERIGAEACRVVFPGHGEPLIGDDIQACIGELEAKKTSKLNVFLGAVRACGFGTGEDIARHVAGDDCAAWRRRRPMSRYYSMLETAVMLRKLKEQGCIERDFDAYCAVYRYFTPDAASVPSQWRNFHSF